VGNPNGCFDWFKYTDANQFVDPFEYVTKEGPQMEAMFEMIQRAAGLIP